MFLPIFRNRRKPKLHQSSRAAAYLQTIIKKTFLNLLQKYKQIFLTEYESVSLKMSRLKYRSQNVSLIVYHFKSLSENVSFKCLSWKISYSKFLTKKFYKMSH